MKVLKAHKSSRDIALQNRETPELHRRMFPYTNISRVEFDNMYVSPEPADPMFITDTTFRDGQQARPPYSPKQIAAIYELLYRLGGKSGLIHACEFFMYTEKDRAAIELCRAKGHKYPRITGWIRANLNDLKLARDMEFREVGMLTSVSDYHIYLKLGWDRKKAMDHYVAMAEKALEWGISPRCHFEDITRADIEGFCLPLAVKLMNLAEQADLPVKIRLCDTMGYGVPFPGATLPRSVGRLVQFFTHECGVPGKWLEWHGHNDFHKTLVNGVTAWLNGCSGVNGTLFGFGERTGNTPIEALVIDYISITGDDDAAHTPVIAEIADYFEKELEYRIPNNYPFVGKSFNATSAGIHADGLIKNEEIYNIFDTTNLLGRSVPIIITDKSGRAGIAYWVNQYLNLPANMQVSKKHPGVGKIYDRVMQLYEQGRNTSISDKELMAMVQRYMPEMLASEFDQMKKLAGELSAHLISRLAKDCNITSGAAPDPENTNCLQNFVEQYPFIQYVYLTDDKGKLLNSAITDPAYSENYNKLPLGFDFSERSWFKLPMRDGGLHISDIYQSLFTGKLVLTVSMAVSNEEDDITGVVGADIQLEQLMKRAEAVEEDVLNDDYR